MKKITLILSLFTLLALNFSCIGPKGDDGLDGLDGKDANVGAAVYDIAPSKWSGNIDGFKTTLPVPEITEDIFYNGAVLVYMIRNENSTDKSFNQLPYTWLNGTNTEYMDYDAYIGELDISLRWVDNGENNTEAPTTNYTFKVIVISGTQLSALKAKTDISNPDAVMEYMRSNPILY
ncbi:MAG TPA: hypothetical protein PKH79_08125 [Prolixibacteraceae bacterium]|nr:hypothetical protein [Prolixibacteraceae bacterium]HPS12258.1 hypothetical protein [Prolixibacteraceae bacterium]